MIRNELFHQQDFRVDIIPREMPETPCYHPSITLIASR